MATADAKAVTKEEWLEGIPPVFQRSVNAISCALLLFDCNSTMTALRSWAKNQLLIAERKTGFSKKALNSTVRRDALRDIF